MPLFNLQHSGPLFLAIFSTLLIVEISYFYFQAEIKERLPFGISLAQIDFSLAPIEQAFPELEQEVQQFLKTPLKFTVGENKFILAPQELNLQIRPRRLLATLPENLVAFTNYALPVTLDEDLLNTALLAKIPELNYPAKNAEVYFSPTGELKIKQESPSYLADVATLAAEIKKVVSNLQQKNFKVVLMTREPPITQAILEAHKDDLSEILEAPLVLKETEFQRFEILLTERLNLLDFSQEVLQLNPLAFENFLIKELGPILEYPAEIVALTENSAGEIEFTGVAQLGREIDQENLRKQIELALATKELEVAIPFEIIPATPLADVNLKKQGFQELIASAETNYAGSPPNRQHNIKIGAEKFNGFILEPNTEFSFLAELGPITTQAGYRSELIIKQNKIIPELGGGICQVSTTIFRAALAAGLPITSQKPHSLKVSYYYPPGLDSTIYPGIVDLKFVNDTGYPILFQLAVLADERLRVNFFGLTTDDREVTLKGPFYLNGQPITDLSRAGLRMFWTREVKKAGVPTLQEEYFSYYRMF